MSRPKVTVLYNGRTCETCYELAVVVNGREFVARTTLPEYAKGYQTPYILRGLRDQLRDQLSLSVMAALVCIEA